MQTSISINPFSNLEKPKISMLFIILMLSIVLASCSSSTRMTTIKDMSNQQWSVDWVSINKQNGLWRVWGEMRSKYHNVDANGQILISIVTEDGNLLEQKTAVYKKRKGTTRFHRSRHPDVAYFTCFFQSIPKNTIVVIEPEKDL
ncbi:hypothetical protein [Aliiglaciecola aliphaticivorans]|jgi:hypothetical protein